MKKVILIENKKILGLSKITCEVWKKVRIIEKDTSDLFKKD